MVGFAGEAQGFDGNGSYKRTATGGGADLIKTGKLSGRPGEPVAAVRARDSPAARHPAQATVKAPPYNTSRACYKNAQPNLNGPAAAGRPA